MEPDARAWSDGAWRAASAALPRGPGVFETMRVERGAVAFWREHRERLERGARSLALPWPPPVELGPWLAHALAALPVSLQAVRLAWCPPALHLSARALTKPPDATELFVGDPCMPLRPFGAKTVERGPYEVALRAARERGAFEALVHGSDGTCIEGSFTNVFIVRAGRIETPPLASGALPGIVRGVLLAELERRPPRLGGEPWTVHELPLSLSDLAAAEEVLLTNSLVRVVGAARILGRGARTLPGRDGRLARVLLDRLERLEADSLRVPASDEG
jgi:para-aminobenzoate synthetase/4-amino-4-deoxychorismate lyase